MLRRLTGGTMHAKLAVMRRILKSGLVTAKGTMRADVVRCGEEARENSNGTVTCWLLTICSLLLIALPTFAQTAPPDVGQKAHDFSLRTPEGAEVRL